MRVETVLGPDELVLARFSGQESVSQPFLFQIEMRSENDSIEAKDLLRTAATIIIELENGEERQISGLIRRFSQHGSFADITTYQAEIVPWFWFLTLSRDCQIFQNKSVTDIIEAVFKQQGYKDFEIRCNRTYDKREFCVQYRESHFNFVSRLMEEEGIFYYFKHADGKHTMVLADTASTLTACPFMSEARVAPQAVGQSNVVTDIQGEHSVFIGKVTLGEYDYLQPSLTLRGSSQGDGREQSYDYLPVSYTKLDDGDRYARIQLEAEEAMQWVIRGAGTCSFMQSGFRFDLKEHYRADLNSTFLLLEVQHSASVSEYRTTGSTTVEYSNEFIAIPHDVPYRPPRRAQKPSVAGTQSAVVVGPAGEEIWTDKHGRVKVQFHWDRVGKKNENSSCWVRVSSLWAGKGWGMINIPRIGQEVLVDFLEGDVDRPIIVGRLYNAEQTPPYALPNSGTQSGIKSRSSPGGNNDTFNEIRLEDKKGSELMFIHAQKDKEVLVENDRKEEVKHDETIKIGNNRTEEVVKDETIKVGGKRTEEVTGQEKVTIKAARAHEVKGNDELNVGSKRTVTVKMDDKLDVGMNMDVAAKMKIAVKANLGIEFKVGASTLKITPASIELKAPVVKVEANGVVQVKAPVVMAQADGMMQAKGAITQVNGDGILMLKGGLTMIN
jgi:type VI secretion system secreted protein VgrG